MRRVPSCLLFASLLLFPAVLDPKPAQAQPGFRLGGSAHSASAGHLGRGHWGRSHRGLAGPRFHARHVPAFRRHGFYGPRTYGYGHSGFGFARRGYGTHRYSHRFGFPTHGQHGYGRYGYGYSGHGRGYGSHGYYGYGSYGRGFYSGSWLWPRADVTVIPVAAVGPTGPHPYPHIPSLADLPVSVGIRSAPVASPTVFVLSAGRRSLRTGGAKIVGRQRSDAGGPRIIRVDVPRGR